MSDFQGLDTLNGVIQQAIKVQIRQTVHTCIPGQIESWDGKLAEVLPLVPALLLDGKNLSYPRITDVPVVFPGSSDTTFSFPLKRGDGVLLLFAERNIDRWLQQGGEQTAETGRRYSITDCIAIPGLFSTPEIPGGSYDTENVNINFKQAKIVIDTNGNVTINDHLKVSL